MTKRFKYDIFLSLTAGRPKNRCIPCIYRAAAIFTVVTESGNLFLPLTFFLNGSHTAFRYELIIGPEAADLMKIIRDGFPFV